MTYRESILKSYFSGKSSQGVILSSLLSGASVTVTGLNNIATIRLSIDSITIADFTVTFPSGSYGDAIMAAGSVDYSIYPFKITGVNGYPAIEATGLNPGVKMTYLSGTATWLGFSDGQSLVASDKVISPISQLEDRILKLESGGSGGGAAILAFGGANSEYGSMSGTVSTGTLGYVSGNGYAAVSPMFVEQTLTFSKIGIEIGTLYPAAITYTCLLYDHADSYPATLLMKQDVSTTLTGGKKYASITPIELKAGTYWIGAWVGVPEGAGKLVNNTPVGLVMPYSPTGSGNTGNLRLASGWKSNSISQPTIGSSWPSRSSTGMFTSNDVPRVTMWAG